MIGRLAGGLAGLVLAAALAGCGATPPLPSGASLGVGECIDPPTAGTVVTDAKRRACDRPHGGEVFYVGQLTGFGAPPTDDQARKYEVSKPFEGVMPNLERRWRETDSEWMREELSKYQSDHPCSECNGYRL